MAKVTMPQLGESVAEGTIGRWLKQPGDTVAKYEPLVEVITDKVNAEVPSPFAGVLTEILAEEGATVPNNAEIAIIETEEEAGGSPATAPAGVAEPAPVASSVGAALHPPPAPPAAPAAAAAVAPAAAPAPAARARGAVAASPVDRPPSRPRRPPSRPERPHDPGGPPPAARARPGGRADRRHRRRRPDHPRGRPRARRGGPHRRRPHGRPAAAPVPTDRGRDPGRRPRSAATAVAGTAIVFPPGADEVVVPMTQMRKGIAAQMTRALAVPHAYVQVEIDATTSCACARASRGTTRRRRALGSQLRALRRQGGGRGAQAQPDLQRHLDRPGTGRQAADQRSASPSPWTTGSSSRSSATSTRCRSAASTSPSPTSRPGPGRTSCGSTTSAAARSRSTTPGWFGSNLTMPIINVPEVAILTMEAITKRPVVVRRRQGDVIAIRPIMNMVIGIDHRAPTTARAAPPPARRQGLARGRRAGDGDLLRLAREIPGCRSGVTAG